MGITTDNPTEQVSFERSPKGTPPNKPIWLVFFGILLSALGAFAFTHVVTATVVSVNFIAICVVLAGAAQITIGLQSRLPRRMLTWVLLGTLYLGAGLFALFNPLMAAGVITLLLGAALISVGFVRLILALQMMSDSQWLAIALSAALTVLLGIMVLAHWPASSLYILGVFLSVDLIFAGLCWILVGATAMSAITTATGSTS